MSYKITKYNYHCVKLHLLHVPIYKINFVFRLDIVNARKHTPSYILGLTVKSQGSRKYKYFDIGFIRNVRYLLHGAVKYSFDAIPL
jgi:hypothetical protein